MVTKTGGKAMTTIKKQVGRPKKGKAMTNAEKQSAYRQRKKEKTEIEEAKLLKSNLIDLSAVAIWKRKN